MKSQKWSIGGGVGRPLRSILASAVVLGAFAAVAPQVSAATAPVLITKTGNISLIVSNTTSEEERGLGVRASLPQNEGMLFEFAKPDSVCLWMKDMHFPLDMIWLNKNKQVIYLVQKASPKTYPKVWCAPGNTDFVIEVNSGIASAAGISVGQTLNFN